MLKYDIQFKAASAQIAPVWFDADKTIDKMIGFIETAARNGAKLIAFPENIIPGYFYNIWTEYPLNNFLFFNRLLSDNSLEVGDARFQRLMKAARDNNIYVVTGFSERDGGSLYISAAIIGDDGHLLATRRKLKPTNAERTMAGDGTGADLKVVKTNIGNIGVNCCWEHIQPLITYANAAQREQIHVAAWPGVPFYQGNGFYAATDPDAQITLSRAYAIMNTCFVICSTSIVDEAGVEFFKQLDPDRVGKLIETGGGVSRIFGTDGRDLTADQHIPEDQEGIVYADLDLNDWMGDKFMADIVGQYSRPDIFSVHINKSANPHTVVINDDSRNDPRFDYDAVNAEFDAMTSKPEE